MGGGLASYPQVSILIKKPRQIIPALFNVAGHFTSCQAFGTKSTPMLERNVCVTASKETER